MKQIKLKHNPGRRRILVWSCVGLLTAKLTVCFQVAKLGWNWLRGELVSFVRRPVLLVLPADGCGSRQAGEAGGGGGRGGVGHLGHHLLAVQEAGQAGGRLGGRRQGTVACKNQTLSLVC